MVASSQTGVYALYEIYDDFDATENSRIKQTQQLNDLYINAVLKRDALFQIVGSDIEESSLEKEEISSDNAPATDFVLVGYLCSGLALLFLLSGIICAFSLLLQTVPYCLHSRALAFLILFVCWQIFQQQ